MAYLAHTGYVCIISSGFPTCFQGILILFFFLTERCRGGGSEDVSRAKQCVGGRTRSGTHARATNTAR